MEKGRGAMKRRGEIQREGNERETLHSVAPSRVENAALCWGSLCIREEVPGLKEKKALVRLRWRRIRGRKGLFTRPFATKAQRDPLFLTDYFEVTETNDDESGAVEEFPQRNKSQMEALPPPFFFLIYLTILLGCSKLFFLRLAFLAIFLLYICSPLEIFCCFTSYRFFFFFSLMSIWS